MNVAVANRIGILMALAAFGLAYTLRLQWSWLTDSILLALAAGMCVGLDLFWRVGKGKRKWFRSASGGSILYMPLWLLGLAWLGLCAYQTYVKPIPALAKAAPQMTWSTPAPAQAESQPTQAKKASR